MAAPSGCCLWLLPAPAPFSCELTWCFPSAWEAETADSVGSPVRFLSVRLTALSPGAYFLNTWVSLWEPVRPLLRREPSNGLPGLRFPLFRGLLSVWRRWKGLAPPAASARRLPWEAAGAHSPDAARSLRAHAPGATAQASATRQPDSGVHTGSPVSGTDGEAMHAEMTGPCGLGFSCHTPAGAGTARGPGTPVCSRASRRPVRRTFRRAGIREEPRSWDAELGGRRNPARSPVGGPLPPSLGRCP